MNDPKMIRNIAIIAHVDHGKTTLVDQLLRQSGTFRDNQELIERVMDSNDLEREKGITIFSKIASIHYKGMKINIVDTPGHSDFSGEVERILMMVDGVLLLVDACEGPMPQTKFVLRKSLALDLVTIVVINKIDRKGARINEVINAVGDLYIDLGADDTQIEFPVIYASARNGTAVLDVIKDTPKNMDPLFNMVLSHCPAPVVDTEGGLQMSINAMDYNDFIGRIGIGKIFQGSIKIGDDIILINHENEHIRHTITKLFTYEGLKRKEIGEAFAGDIIAIAGVPNLNIGDTITSVENPEPLPRIKIEEPTLSVDFLVNDSPFYGKEGKFITSRHLFERLKKETLTDVALRVEGSEDSSVFKVSGRGELHLAILMERMRREGYEFQISKPEVIMKELNNEKLEPIELLVIEVPEDKMGAVIDKINQRKGELRNITKEARVLLEFLIPTRGIIGFRTEFLTMTKGEGTMYHTFEYHKPYKGEIKGREQGSLIALEEGSATSYALDTLSDRGEFFVKPGDKVYKGMVIGMHNKNKDLVVNICKKKHLTNMRSSTSDETIKLTPAKKMSLEECLEYIETDELMEITPHSIRLRKKVLDHDQRKDIAKARQQEEEAG
ncbi:MAG: translational GTPase TypA [bacterium]|nr:translational GTPase TypA [bacterium]